MQRRKEERQLISLDYIILVLSLVGLSAYIPLFILFKSNLRYLFLIFGTYASLTMFSSINTIVKYNKTKKEIKYNEQKVNLKILNSSKKKTKKAI